MAIQCDSIGREDYAQPPFQITTHCVRGDGVNGKPENDEPEGRFVEFEEVARVAAAVCLPKELLAEAEIGNDLPFRTAKFVSFVVFGTPSEALKVILDTFGAIYLRPLGDLRYWA